MGKSVDREEKDKDKEVEGSIKEGPELEISGALNHTVQGGEIPEGEEESLDSLKEEIETKKRGLGELQDRYLRLYAEFENFKKVVSKEQAELLRYGNERLIVEILPVIDNLERAILHSKELTNKADPESREAIDSLISGVEMTLRQIKDILGRFGVREISALGEVFDPTLHHAVSQIETGEHKPNTVIEELRRGYLLNDRVIRPTMVVVSKIPEPQNSSEESGVGSLESEGGD